VTSAGTISSPGYPSNYGNSLLCGWQISAGKLFLFIFTASLFLIIFLLLASFQTVRITFKDFTTESCCDFVELYDSTISTTVPV